MVVSPSICIINSTDQSKESTMTVSRETQTNTTTNNPTSGFTMQNAFAQFQQSVNSFNSGALYIGGRKATPQMLMPMAVAAKVQLDANLRTCIKKGLLDAAVRYAEDAVALDDMVSQLRLRRDFLYALAENNTRRS
jgi:hypothetical protein